MLFGDSKPNQVKPQMNDSLKDGISSWYKLIDMALGRVRMENDKEDGMVACEWRENKQEDD